MAAKRSKKKTAARGAKKKVIAKKAPAKKPAAKKAKAKKAIKAKPKPKAPAARRAAPARKPAAAAPAAAMPAGIHGPPSRATVEAALASNPAARAPADKYSRLVWVDLMTQNFDQGKQLYSSLLGWTTKSVPIPSQPDPYTIWSARGQDFGGLVRLRESGEQSSWLPYILVENVEQIGRRAQELGGSVVVPPTQIPGVGRFTVVKDPTGGTVAPMSFAQEPAPQPAGPNLFGPVAYSEMVSDDVERALPFYTQLFSWVPVYLTDPIFGGYYLFFGGGRLIGGIYSRPPSLPRNEWLTYFDTTDVDTSHQNALTSGATQLIPPTEFAGVGRISWLLDPQNALFGLLKYSF